MSFRDLGVRDELLSALDGLGFETPMAIQAKAIPLLLAGEQDFIGLAQTGTGKTCAFGLPLIQMIDPDHSEPRGLILCPTRELCIQITSDLDKFAKHVDDLNIVPVYGGASIVAQIKQLKRGAGIIVATPGRLIDLIKRKAIDLSMITHVVLDEADEMLNMGFKEDIDTILESVPDDRLVWLFSATMPAGVAAIAANYLNNPVEISVGDKNRGGENIVHQYYIIHERDRYQALKRIIDYAPEMFGLVFCRTRQETQTVAEKLIRDGYQAEALHGDLSQAQRDYVMRKFRQGGISVLVATDVAARGLDVNDITHVIHYKLPDETAVYTHRSGRTARAGKSGLSIALVNTRETRRIRELEKRVNGKFERKDIPDGQAVCERQLFFLIEKIIHTDVNEAEIADYFPAIRDTLERFDKEELIKRFVSTEFNRFLDYYRGSSDINVSGGGEDGGRRQRRQRENRDMMALSINAGWEDKINKGAIVRMICDSAKVDAGAIGDIRLKRGRSIIEVDAKVAEEIKEGLSKADFDGQKLEVRIIGKAVDAPPDKGDRGGRNNFPPKKRGGQPPWKRGGKRGGGKPPWQNKKRRDD